ELARTIAYLQAPALNNGLRSDTSEHDLDVDALRDTVTASQDVEQVEVVELRRVTFKSVASILLVALAAFLLVSSLSEIGIDTIIEELSTAIWAWVLIALLTAQFARVWSGIGTTGATNHPLRLGPTIVLEFAITFVNLVIPSSAARFATKMRYFQKAGMTLPSATAMGAIDSLAVFTVQITVLLSALLFGLGGVEFTIDVDEDAVQRLAAIVGILVLVTIVVCILVYAFVPKVHERVRTTIRQVRDALRVVRSPRRLLRLFGGNAMSELTFAAVLGFSLLAYGESASIFSLLVINVSVALLAGLMPVPGGIGVSEAALTAGLVAIGIPEATAFAAAITARLCTFYLPPIWGYFAMRWLRENDYL
ncbi:MAG: lysylphosphatidylglycerol synthase transmembrane domain-containing protein, partial [Ilumatobacteraceae bacterium]